MMRGARNIMYAFCVPLLCRIWPEGNVVVVYSEGFTGG